jgi:glutamate synthase (NADPH/NADH) small chain
LIAIGRGPNSFLQKNAGINTGKRNSIAITHDFKTSMKKVFAAGDVTSGETLIVKAMEKGREAAQRVHEYLMGLESDHESFYERYYTNKSYDNMLKGREELGAPPD